MLQNIVNLNYCRAKKSTFFNLIFFYETIPNYLRYCKQLYHLYLSTLIYLQQVDRFSPFSNQVLGTYFKDLIINADTLYLYRITSISTHLHRQVHKTKHRVTNIFNFAEYFTDDIQVGTLPTQSMISQQDACPATKSKRHAIRTWISVKLIRNGFRR